MNTKQEILRIEEYEKKGYTSSYQFENDALVDVDSKKSYAKDAVTIEKQYRFEGFTNPSDLSILYILKMNDGTKGTLLTAYGPKADAELAWFLKEVEEINSK
ncbi:hypothetical protein [Tenacibaculum sp. IB213877]|uniref:hypothetical protein n=1 Tax=Tenacibaculum sp. IB213877 TaxID=3097351 RepID=UPI002A5987F6|nr:hypothetical protein [Tenacibaculum sp. IB213877]MDY0780126.1 hypothetical protein [Tenacibaculum sp. IB213877]